MDILSYAIGKKSGSGGDVSGTVDISSNGTHNVASYAYASVAVPNTYTASDEGKVVDDGALVAQSSQTVTANGTYDTTLKNEVVVNIPTASGVDF